MAIVEILLRAFDQTGPGFQSARAGLGALSSSAAQTSGSLSSLSSASNTTAIRIAVLTDRIRLQEQNLNILDIALKQTAAAHAADSVQVLRAQLAYDRQTTSINQNRAALDRLHTEQATATPVLARTQSGIAGVTTALGSLGIAFGVAEIARAGFNAIGSANSLEKTEATLLALSGTQERYTEVIRLSKAAQDLYGGTLQAQEENFRGLIPLSRSANVELGALDQTVRKLALLDPNSAAGGGAAIAIREFLTASDATGALSLQHRFELDKKALQELIKAFPDATDRIKAFNALLEQQGITDEAVAAAANTTAASYDRLGAAASNAQVRVGGLLREQLQPYAEGLAGLLNLLAGETGKAGTAFGRAGQTFMEPFFRTPPMLRSTEGAAVPVSSVAAASSGAPQTATGAPVGTVINQTINVQGSIHSTQELKDIAHQGLLEYQNRNGGTGIRP